MLRGPRSFSAGLTGGTIPGAMPGYFAGLGMLGMTGAAEFGFSYNFAWGDHFRGLGEPIFRSSDSVGFGFGMGLLAGASVLSWPSPQYGGISLLNLSAGAVADGWLLIQNPSPLQGSVGGYVANTAVFCPAGLAVRLQMQRGLVATQALDVFLLSLGVSWIYCD